MNLRSRQILHLVLWFGLAFHFNLGVFAQTEKDTSGRPNFVFAIADDWGWPHASAYGDKALKTPNFDSIAKRGVLFENAFVSSPSCTPSRGAIITGQHFFRLKAGMNLWCHWPENEFAEFPKLLSEAGYHVGSWRKAWGPGKGQPGGKRYANVDKFFEAKKPNQPFCLWFGAHDPHRGYKKGSGQKSGIDLSKVHLFEHYPDVKEIRSDVADYYFEVQRFDNDLGKLTSKLRSMGEIENTIIFVTGDHGMPFPRCKANLYDSGTHVPLAIQWPGKFPADRRVNDFVSLTDIAPTILDAAGIKVPSQMTGKSLLPILKSNESGWVTKQRDHVIFGKERHVPCQEIPERAGYPMRALRTAKYLYIRNYRPELWPSGTPNHKKANNKWLADCDNGPTKTFLWNHRTDPAYARNYELCFGKRPKEELYDLAKDPGQINNVADAPAYRSQKEELSNRLTKLLKQADDPRELGKPDEFFEKHEYLGRGPRWPFGQQGNKKPSPTK